VLVGIGRGQSHARADLPPMIEHFQCEFPNFLSCTKNCCPRRGFGVNEVNSRKTESQE
jgi:hypothetical protein